jgi:hypothetical protein
MMTEDEFYEFMAKENKKVIGELMKRRLRKLGLDYRPHPEIELTLAAVKKVGLN